MSLKVIDGTPIAISEYSKKRENKQVSRIERWTLTKEIIDEMNALRKKLGFEQGNYVEGQVLEVLIK